MKMRLIVLSLVLLVFPALANAGQFGKLQSAQGRPVFVIDQDHREWQGRLIEIAKESITIDSEAGAHKFRLADVKRIDADGDNVLDGALKGAIFGAVIGLLMSDYGGPKIVLGSAMSYGLIGVAMDAMNHCKQTVYRGAAPQLSVTLRW